MKVHFGTSMLKSNETKAKTFAPMTSSFGPKTQMMVTVLSIPRNNANCESRFPHRVSSEPQRRHNDSTLTVQDER